MSASSTLSIQEGPQAEAQFRAVFEHAPIGMAIVSLQGDWLHVNRALCDMLGYDAGSLLATSFRELTHPDDFAVDYAFAQLALSGQIRDYRMQTRYFHRDGRTLPIALHAALAHDAQGLPQYFILRIEDISQRKLIEDALFAEKDLAQTTLRSIADAVLTTDRDGHVRYLNPTAERLCGWTMAQAGGLALEQVLVLLDAATQQAAVNALAPVFSAGQTINDNGGLVLVSRDGPHYAIEITAAPIRVPDGSVTGAVLVFRDVTEALANRHRMSFQASHDALTGLWNRAEFEAMTRRLLHSARVMSQQHALLYLDLDQFKIVNDTCGHAAGDQLLRQLSGLLLSHTRKSDMLARLGGDEFGILLDSCPLARAVEIAQNLVDVVCAFRFEWEGKLFGVGVSIGVMPFDGQTKDHAAIVRGADAACYCAKEKGRNRVEVFVASAADLVEQRSQFDWGQRLLTALEQDGFALVFQKIVPVTAESDPARAVHVEALLRYRDADGRLLPPMAFLPAAQRLGLSVAIDRWVVAAALRHAPLAWLSEHDASFLAINLCAASIADPDFREFVLGRLRAGTLPGHRICFEISDTAAVSNLHALIDFIFQLRLEGCRFCLDNFGSGLSSFGYLKSLPVDFLKIDGVLVKNIARNPVDLATVEAIRHIAVAMGVKTIAKGVEDEQVLEKLVLAGIDYVQGFAIHAPQAYVMEDGLRVE